ncbi:hypothetical protein D3C75_1129760 [compost metagenome]
MVDLIFRQPPDIRFGLPLTVGTQQLRQTALAQGAGLDIIVEDFSEQVGRVHQRLFGGLSHPRANLFTHSAENEKTGQPDKQEIDQENPDPQAH